MCVPTSAQHVSVLHISDIVPPILAPGLHCSRNLGGSYSIKALEIHSWLGDFIKHLCSPYFISHCQTHCL